MTNQKLYALKTSDTGEWVKWDYKFRDRPGYRLWDYPVEIVPEDQRFICLSARASKDTGHPCEWVELWVIEAKSVPPESELGKDCPYMHFDTRMAWLDGINYCLRYLGVG